MDKAGQFGYGSVWTWTAIEDIIALLEERESRIIEEERTAKLRRAYANFGPVA